MSQITTERALSVLGVTGWLRPRHAWDHAPESLFSSQKWISERRLSSGKIRGVHDTEYLIVTIRFDDACRNGHNTFAITGDIRSASGREIACGCVHDDIARVPELAPLIKWHLLL